MPTVVELSDPYANFMRCPRPGPDVCSVCFNLTDGYGRCYACAHGEAWLDAMLPVSYSIAGEQLHHALAGYKRGPHPVARYFALGLAAVLWRHLAAHERCIAAAAGVEAFPVVTTVPSTALAAEPEPHGRHALDRLVTELVAPLRDRWEPLLRRSALPVQPHQFAAERYEPAGDPAGRPVLLIDDTWTTGANAQSAAAVLKAAGSGPVAAVVIGRHLNRGWRQNDRRLRALPQPFDWSRCALCVGEAPAVLAEPLSATTRPARDASSPMPPPAARAR